MVMMKKSEKNQTSRADLTKTSPKSVYNSNYLLQNNLIAPPPVVPVSQSIKEYIIKEFANL